MWRLLLGAFRLKLNNCEFLREFVPGDAKTIAFLVQADPEVIDGTIGLDPESLGVTTPKHPPASFIGLESNIQVIAVVQIEIAESLRASMYRNGVLEAEGHDVLKKLKDLDKI